LAGFEVTTEEIASPNRYGELRYVETQKDCFGGLRCLSAGSIFRTLAAPKLNSCEQRLILAM
jgi:hypothetical protein